VVYQYGLNHDLRWFFYVTPDIRKVKSVSSEAASSGRGPCGPAL
jgi:hypothetical protein